MRKSGSKPLSGEEEQSKRSLKPMNSFERESLDDIIHEFDQAENVITNSSEPSKKQHLSHAESFTVDNVLRSADEAMAAPRRTVIQTVTRRPASSTPNKIDETRAPSSADDEDAVELKELIPPTSAGQRKSPSNEIISTKRESISPPPSNAEAVKATLQRESALREEVGQKFHVLLSQMLEFHIKMREANVKINTYASQRAELEVSIEDLQKENNLLQNRLHNRDQSAHRYSLESKKLARGNDVRRAALLLENVEEDFVYKMDPSNQKKKDQSWVSHLEQRFVALLPFSADVRKIDSRFGSSVAAYFDFYRFMFLQFLLVAVVCVILLGYHLASLTNRGQIMGLFNSKGILPGFLNFSSFDPSENLLYSTIVVVGSTIFIFTLLFQVIHKDKVGLYLHKSIDCLCMLNLFRYRRSWTLWKFRVTPNTLKKYYGKKIVFIVSACLTSKKFVIF